MANANIKVNTSELEGAISAFNTAKSNAEVAYLRMADAVGTLDTTWNGDASEAFKERFEALKQNLKTSDTTITTAISFLKSAVSEYEQAEEAANQMAGAVDTTNPFTE